MIEILYDLQLWVRDVLVERMDAARDADLLALAAILPLGILFGALHALTPGHSKTILASYVVGSGDRALRSVGVAGLLSMTHVGSAVVLVLLGAPLITTTLIGAGRAPALETVSRAIVLAVGCWLLVRALMHRHSRAAEGGVFAVAAGLVPCPLTLFVMLASLQRGTVEIGILWALAMAGGVAVTLAATALFAVFARGLFVGLVDRHGNRIELVSRVAEGAAGLALIALAAVELAG